MRFLFRALCFALLLPWSLGCGDRLEEREGENSGRSDHQAEARAARMPPEEADIMDSWPLVAFLGDSLTAGFGVAQGEAYPAVVAGLLEDEGYPVRIVNGGISGDTSAGGLNRVDWLLSRSPDLVVVDLGANDGLRGLDLAATEENLRQILRKVKGAGARALLVGIYVPPNYGPSYSQSFAALFPRLAEEQEVALLPFLLEGVAGIPELNQVDGVHPNREGHRKVAQQVFSPWLSLLREAEIDG